ncbi:MAG: TfuA-like protein [Sphingomonadaceae bacterium]|nr:TfuA-like protein [Sphingomonadaceae bacterium]
MTRPVLFAGPTIHGLAPGLLEGLDVRPPARLGDVARAIADRPPAIGLIDGVFGSAPSVWHRELLHAMSEGIAAFGGGSLGAIRAAELAPFGMTGIGAVYDAYASGAVVRDDAVLVMQGPAELSYPPLTIALIDAEAIIRAAPLEPGLRARLLQRARRMPFHLRTWSALAEAADLGDAAPVVRSTLKACGRSVKREDAVQLIGRLRITPGGQARPRPVVHKTGYYDALLRSIADRK